MGLIRRFILGIVLNVAALYGVTLVLEQVHYEGGVLFFLIGGMLIGLLNSFLKPILKLVSFPLVFLTGGFFLVIINALIFWLAEYLITILDFSGVSLTIEGFHTYLLAAVIFGVVNWFTHWILKD